LICDGLQGGRVGFDPRPLLKQFAKARLPLVSITQELGDDPMSNMIRQIMALFDEYLCRPENVIGHHSLVQAATHS